FARSALAIHVAGVIRRLSRVQVADLVSRARNARTSEPVAQPGLSLFVARDGRECFSRRSFARQARTKRMGGRAGKNFRRNRADCARSLEYRLNAAVARRMARNSRTCAVPALRHLPACRLDLAVWGRKCEADYAGASRVHVTGRVLGQALEHRLS